MPRKDDQHIYRHPRERKGDPGSQYGAGTDTGGAASPAEKSAGYKSRQSYSPGHTGFRSDDAGHDETGGEEDGKKLMPRSPQKPKN